MFKIKGTSIELTRGDTAVFELTLTDADGVEYTLHPGDIIVFSLKASTASNRYLFQKEFIENTMKIDPSDTSLLSCGTYTYDIQLTNREGDVFTVVEPSRFTIKEEVTR